MGLLRQTLLRNKGKRLLIVRLVGVGKRYGTRWVLRDQHATFGPGVHNIIGSNGSGKSTLLRMIVGIEQATRGEVCYTGGSGEAAGRSMLIAPYLHMPLHVRTSELVAGYVGWGRVRSVLSDVGLLAHGGSLCSALSSGMQQKVLLGCAVWGSRSLVLLDEPFSHLDEAATAWGHTQLGKLVGQGKTCLVATQRAVMYAKEEIKIKKYFL